MGVSVIPIVSGVRTYKIRFSSEFDFTSRHQLDFFRFNYGPYDPTYAVGGKRTGIADIGFLSNGEWAQAGYFVTSKSNPSVSRTVYISYSGVFGDACVMDGYVSTPNWSNSYNDIYHIYAWYLNEKYDLEAEFPSDFDIQTYLDNWSSSFAQPYYVNQRSLVMHTNLLTDDPFDTPPGYNYDPEQPYKYSTEGIIWTKDNLSTELTNWDAKGADWENLSVGYPLYPYLAMSAYGHVSRAHLFDCDFIMDDSSSTYTTFRPYFLKRMEFHRLVSPFNVDEYLIPNKYTFYRKQAYDTYIQAHSTIYNNTSTGTNSRLAGYIKTPSYSVDSDGTFDPPDLVLSPTDIEDLIGETLIDYSDTKPCQIFVSDTIDWVKQQKLIFEQLNTFFHVPTIVQYHKTFEYAIEDSAGVNVAAEYATAVAEITAQPWVLDGDVSEDHFGYFRAFASSIYYDSANFEETQHTQTIEYGLPGPTRYYFAGTLYKYEITTKRSADYTADVKLFCYPKNWGSIPEITYDPFSFTNNKFNVLASAGSTNDTAGYCDYMFEAPIPDLITITGENTAYFRQYKISAFGLLYDYREAFTAGEYL